MALPGKSPTRLSSASEGSGASGAGPGPERTPTATNDWPLQATDTIVRVVDNVRDRTTGPALNAARWVIYGAVIGVLVLPLLVFALVFVFRGLEGILLWVSERGSWSAWLHDPIGFVYLFVGSAFCIAGFWSWKKAR